MTQTMTEPVAPPQIVTDFASDDFLDRPYEYYAAYHRDTPVFQNQEGVVYLSRYDDCVKLLTGKQFQRTPPDGGASPFASEIRQPSPMETMISNWMIFMDPPRHERVRQAFSQPFTLQSLKRAEPAIQSLTRELVDTFRHRDQVELVSEFAFPMPVLVICEILGVPAEDRHLFHEWVVHLSHALDSCSDEAMRAAIPTSLAMRDYFTDHLNARMSVEKNDLMDSLIKSIKIGHLSKDEVVCGCGLLIGAGHETTKSLIANSVLTLNSTATHWTLLRAQPDLIAPALEECMRFSGPVHKISRWTSEEVVFGQYVLPRGTLVVALLAAANRDPAVFDNPDEFDIRRAPNRHLAFGKGIHHCLGAVMARLQTTIAVEALLSAFEKIVPLNYQWGRNAMMRGLDSMKAALR